MKKSILLTDMLTVASVYAVAQLPRAFPIIGLFLFLTQNLYGQTDFKEIEIGCINFSKIGKENVFKNSEEYESLKASLSPHPDCSDYEFPKIDFNTYTLVGYHVVSGGCAEPTYKIDVRKDANIITFVFQVKPQGICKMLYEKTFWLLIPKTELEIRFKREKLQ